MDEILNQFGDEYKDIMGDENFDPNNYAIDASMEIYPNADAMQGMEEEMPTYTVDELKIDIEPMLLDLDINSVSELAARMFSTRYNIQNGNFGGASRGGDVVAPEMDIPMDMEGSMDMSAYMA